jgi:hypothetical protein
MATNPKSLGISGRFQMSHTDIIHDDRTKEYDEKREKREFELRWYQARLGFWQAIGVT